MRVGDEKHWITLEWPYSQWTGAIVYNDEGSLSWQLHLVRIYPANVRLEAVVLHVQCSAWRPFPFPHFQFYFHVPSFSTTLEHKVRYDPEYYAYPNKKCVPDPSFYVGAGSGDVGSSVIVSQDFFLQSYPIWYNIPGNKWCRFFLRRGWPVTHSWPWVFLLLWYNRGTR